ncbi:MAG: hypothetical protein M1818_007627 [Claussenomyces sp. TS43310]|nr:MAG: hypothetical protein M1818_007627 [Claussenomyces sp. TS43310]
MSNLTRSPDSFCSTLPASFLQKKTKILSDLAVPVEAYDDLSPKGSIDVGIRDLIDEINALAGFVTTSSCAGRVSVFAEGQKKLPLGQDPSELLLEQQGERERAQTASSQDDDGEDARPVPAKLAGTGGKGGGGRWLFVSHDKVDTTLREHELLHLLGMQAYGIVESESKEFREERLIHFKFEPMILHILTASLQHAQTLLSAALQAGFRESGALNLTTSNSEPATPMVAVRSMGLGLESVIGRLLLDSGICVVPESFLRGLLSIANERFDENAQRIERFRHLLAESVSASRSKPIVKKSAEGGEWEDADARRARKRAEGLKKAQEMK